MWSSKSSLPYIEYRQGHPPTCLGYGVPLTIVNFLMFCVMKCKVYYFEKVGRDDAMPYYIIRAKGQEGDDNANVFDDDGCINVSAVQSRTFNFTKCLFPGTEAQCEQLEKGFTTDDEHNVTSTNYIRLQLFQWETGKKFYIYSHGVLLTEKVQQEVEKIAQTPITVNGKAIRKGEKYTVIEEVEKPRVFTKISLTLLENADGTIAENGGDAVTLAKRNFEAGIANGIYELVEE